jgi:hypothetical protein
VWWAATSWRDAGISSAEDAGGRGGCLTVAPRWTPYPHHDALIRPRGAFPRGDQRGAPVGPIVGVAKRPWTRRTQRPLRSISLQ